MELGPLTIHLGAVRDILSRPSLSHVDGVREHAVFVLQLATGLLLGFDADVQALDEVPIRDVDVPDLDESPHVDRSDPVAPTEHLRRLAQRPGHAHFPSEAIPGPPGEDPDAGGPPVRIRGLEDGVGELVLGPIATVADHEVHAVGKGRLRLDGRVAVLLGDADVPVHAMPAEYVVQRVEDGLVLARGRVDHHVDPPVRGIRHPNPPKSGQLVNHDRLISLRALSRIRPSVRCLPSGQAAPDRPESADFAQGHVPMDRGSSPGIRWLAIAAILVVAAGVAGCGDHVTSPSPPATSTTPSETTPGLTGAQPTSSASAASRTPTPSSSTGAFQPTVLLAAGDIGRCDSTHDDATGALADRLPGVIATLGDTAYEDGTTEELNDCFGGAWGPVKSRIQFAIMGNHDVHTDNGAPLKAYMGSATVRDGKTWYSDDLGSWHVVVLDGNCGLLGRKCDARSDQATWLRDDLAASSARCTVVLLHQPLFSSGSHGPDRAVRPLWDAMYAGGVDLVLDGHDHDYERFGAQDPGGTADASRGIVEIIAGTGGAPLGVVQEAAAELAVQDRRHLWGGGGHAPGRRLVIAARRRRRFESRPGGGNLPLSPSPGPQGPDAISAPGRGGGFAAPAASAARPPPLRGWLPCRLAPYAAGAWPKPVPGALPGPELAGRRSSDRRRPCDGPPRPGWPPRTGCAPRAGCPPRFDGWPPRDGCPPRLDDWPPAPPGCPGRLARCSARSAGVERSRIGSGRMFRLGSKPAIVSVGIARRRSAWMSWTSGRSSMQTSEIASPSLPARPVRPMRCT